MKLTLSFSIIVLFVFALTAQASETANPLKGELSRISPWIGTWQFKGEWSNGNTLWSQAEYRPILGGAVLDGRVFVSDNGGEVHQRYRSLFRWSKDTGAVESHNFSDDGTYAVSYLSVDGSVSTTEWSSGDTTISERMELTTPDTMRWQVWALAEDGSRTLLIDGVWNRTNDEPVALNSPRSLAPGLRSLERLVGGWETSSKWPDGRSLWARTEYRLGNSGRFIDATTWTVDAEGNGYHGDETIFTEGSVENSGRVVSFNSRGRVSVMNWNSKVEEEQANLAISQTTPTGSMLLQELRFTSATAFDWRAAERKSDDAPWNDLVTGVWLRQGPAAGKREPIDSSRFVAQSPRVRSFVKEREISAPLAQVYAAWSSGEAWEKLWGPQSAGRFDLAIGGRYEWLFNGWLGGNGCQILSYIPDRMISFSWNAPPTQPDNRLARTWVVVETEPAQDGGTRVRLTHLGFGEGEKWDETYTYFDNAWTRVLDLMSHNLGDQSE